MLQRSLISLLLGAFLLLPGMAAAQDAQSVPAQEVQKPQQEPEQKADEKPPEPPPAQDPGQVVKSVETAHPPSAAKKIITNFWHDQKAMWSSPFRMSRKDAKLWSAFGLGTVALVATDKRTSRALPNTVSQVSFSKSVSQIGAAYTTLPIAGGLYLYGKLKDDPKARETGVLSAEALLDSYIIVSILKVGAGRERPEVGDGEGRFFKGHRGFPSGHAMMSWAFASLISHEYAPGKVTPIIAYSLASIVSVSRFSARKHFASDILAGGTMGWFIGRYVFFHHLDPEIHKRYNTNAARLIPEISPMYEPVSRSYGITLGWTP